MKNLVQPVIDNAKKKITRYPCYTNRASTLGYCVPILGGCLRRGVYERTNWNDKELHDVGLQLIFNEGNLQERQVLRDFSDADIDIIEQQGSGEWKDYQISYHLDGVWVEDTVAYPVEIKSCHPQIFDTLFTFDDFRKKPHTRAYMVQITIYMLSKNVDKGIFILKNKSNGMLRQITCDLDFELGEAILKTAEAINKHIAEKTLPDRIADREVCKKCPFKLLCLPEINFGVALKIMDNPNFENLINRYFKIKEIALEASKLWDEIKEYAKSTAENGELNVLCGKYRVTGHTDKRGFKTEIETL